MLIWQTDDLRRDYTIPFSLHNLNSKNNLIPILIYFAILTGTYSLGEYVNILGYKCQELSSKQLKQIPGFTQKLHPKDLTPKSSGLKAIHP